jgi:uncharacterized protein (TIGR03382 family)
MFLVAALVVCGVATQASALTVALSDVDNPVELTFELTEDAGDILLEASIDAGYIGDLRAVYFTISDDSLLPGLVVTGADVTNVVVDAGNVSKAGAANTTMNGSGFASFDVGVEIGTQGIGKDDIASTLLTLSHTSGLSLSLFDEQMFGARVMSLGLDREDSAKALGSTTTGLIPPDPIINPAVPEPVTGVTGLLALAGVGLASLRRRRG